MMNRFSMDIAKGVSPVTGGWGDWRKLSINNFRLCRSGGGKAPKSVIISDVFYRAIVFFSSMRSAKHHLVPVGRPVLHFPKFPLQEERRRPAI
jgi:hypothetical protein